MKRFFKSLPLLAILAGSAAAVGLAEDYTPQQTVARVSFVEGEISYLRGDDQNWSYAGLNTPLTTGDALYAAEDGRVELALDLGNIARLDSATELRLTNLSYGITQLGLTGGYLSFRLASIPEGANIEVDTPNGALTIWDPGIYRIWVDQWTERFGVVSGTASLLLNGEQLDVRSGELLELNTDGGLTYSFAQLPPESDFDYWARQRDRRRDESPSARYVNPAVGGYEDLDGYGDWREVETYGSVWMPARMASDWAPYRSGRWVWQDPYGWTWVSYEAWGWAPYHYGRWVSIRGDWAWVPPRPAGYPRHRYYSEPVYAPALVAFIGGANWSLGISIGSGVGWVPLAPADPYYYAWQRPPTTQINYVNFNIYNSVTVVRTKNFFSGPVHHEIVDQRLLREAPMAYTSMQLGIDPTEQSLYAYPDVKHSERARPPVQFSKRPLVARLVPPPVQHSFKDKLEVIKASGRPVLAPAAKHENVGQPFRAGVKAPKGTDAISAFAERDKGALKPKNAGSADVRRPKQITADVVPPGREGKEGKAAPGLKQEERGQLGPPKAGEAQKGQPATGADGERKPVRPPAVRPLDDTKGQPATGAENPRSVRPLDDPKGRPATGAEDPKPVRPPAGQVKPGAEQKPRPQQPAEPGKAEPRKPQPQQPAEPGKAQPRKPQPQQPAEPGKAEPRKPQPQQPAAPAKAEPKKPRPQQPAAPAKAEPEKQKHQQPAAPAKAEPKKPRPQQPAAPAKAEPEKQKHQQPAAPAKAVPEKQKHQQPVAPAEVRPGKKQPEQPQQPEVKKGKKSRKPVAAGKAPSPTPTPVPVR